MMVRNEWSHGPVKFDLSPLRTSHASSQGATLIPATLDSDVGSETNLFIFDEPQYAKQLGSFKSINVSASSGLVRTSQGMIAFIIWSFFGPEGKLCDFEHLLNPFGQSTIKLLTSVSQQTHLKVLVVDSASMEQAGFYQFENIYELGELAALIARAIDNETESDFKAAQAAFFDEYTISDLLRQ